MAKAGGILVRRNEGSILRCRFNFINEVAEGVLLELVLTLMSNMGSNSGEREGAGSR